jgi:hypothetical protein
MARPKGQYTPRSGPLQGQTFRSYSAYETARAHLEGFTSIRKRQDIRRLIRYDVQRNAFVRRYRDIIPASDEAEFNRRFQQMVEAERKGDKRAELIARARVAAALSTDPAKDEQWYLRRMAEEEGMSEIEEDELIEEA